MGSEGGVGDGADDVGIEGGVGDGADDVGIEGGSDAMAEDGRAMEFVRGIMGFEGEMGLEVNHPSRILTLTLTLTLTLIG